MTLDCLYDTRQGCSELTLVLSTWPSERSTSVEATTTIKSKQIVKNCVVLFFWLTMQEGQIWFKAFVHGEFGIMYHQSNYPQSSIHQSQITNHQLTYHTNRFPHKSQSTKHPLVFRPAMHLVSYLIMCGNRLRFVDSTFGQHLIDLIVLR